MNEKEKVSVIVTVYNKENYIEQCINSILRQSYKELEIIIIDDGSNDNSLEKCIKLTENDTRCLVLTQINKGVSASRNIGINQIKGKYVVFIDGDDYVEENYIEKMIENSRYDLTVCGYNCIDESKTKKNSPMELIQNKKELIPKIVFKNNYFNFFAVPYIKLFHSDIIINNNIRFDLGINYGEDTLFVLKYLKYVKSLKIIPDVLYNNRIVPGTLSRTYINGLWNICELILQQALNFIDENGEEKEFIFFRGIKLTLINESENYNNFCKVCKIIRENKYFKYKSKINDTKNKILYLLIYIKAYCILYFIIKQIIKQ